MRKQNAMLLRWNSEAVSEQIFYLVLKQMQEIIEFWDKTPANGKL